MPLLEQVIGRQSRATTKIQDFGGRLVRQQLVNDREALIEKMAGGCAVTIEIGVIFSPLVEMISYNFVGFHALGLKQQMAAKGVKGAIADMGVEAVRYYTFLTSRRKEAWSGLTWGTGHPKAEARGGAVIALGDLSGGEG